MERFRWPTGVSSAVLVLVTAGAAAGQPVLQSVAGQVTHGSPLTIQGQQLGSRGDHSPGDPATLAFRWKDMEDCTLDSDGFSVSSYPNQWSVQTANARPQPKSSCYARKKYVDSRLGVLESYPTAPMHESFSSFWFYALDLNHQQSGKIFRIGSTNNPPAYTIYLATGCSGLGVRGYSECSSCSPGPTTVWGSPDSVGGGTWKRVDIFLDESQGETSVYLNGKRQWTRMTSCPAGLARCVSQQWVYAPFGSPIRWNVGNMLDGPSSCSGRDGEYSFDDIYFDYSRTRVELCASPTWHGDDAMDTCELQPPVSWSSTQVVVRVNQGAFAAGATAYLYVIDDQGAVNAAGYPVSFGGGQSPASPPEAPHNLRVDP